jgi:hypothetical protein
MPGWNNPHLANMFYSFDIGSVHFVGFDTECDLDVAYMGKPQVCSRVVGFPVDRGTHSIDMIPFHRWWVVGLLAGLDQAGPGRRHQAVEAGLRSPSPLC